MRENKENNKEDIKKETNTKEDIKNNNDFNCDDLYNELIELVEKYHPKTEFAMVEKAYKLAKEAHIDQFRKSGEPYIIHPLEVAKILARLELDLESITAGILHDVIEDTEYTYDDLKELFSEEIANIVDGVTKLEKFTYSSKEEQQAENYRKMFLAMAKDIRVILIKVADRLHNMKTLQFMKPEKQKEIAQETLDIYAPLATRLGMFALKIELEDLCLMYLEPEAYAYLEEKVNNREYEREGYVTKIISDISEKCTENEVNFEIYGRPKHHYSIYNKMKKQKKSIEQIFDLFAVRVVVTNIKECYEVLGIVHEMYKPIAGRFKDYIAMPKVNMYQSLHNTLIGPFGIPFEIQIRTWEMHKIAEYGIAAHWKYKSGDTSGQKESAEEEKLTWLRQILEWQKELSESTKDGKEFVDSIKTNLDSFNDSVYCFSPTGEVKSLPYNACPIDFAYSVHSAVGNKMVGAKVNGKIVTFDYEIQNGDRVEIITSQNSKGPSLDWLKIVKSSQSKNKINQWFKTHNKEENVLKGKELLDKESKRKNYTFPELNTQDGVNAILEKYNFKDWESVCAAIGHGGLKEGQVINKLIEVYEYNKNKNKTAQDIIRETEEYIVNINNKNNKPVDKKANNINKKSKSNNGIVIHGVGGIDARVSKCCNPLPGDEIVGFITKGRGVSVHRTDCINIINIEEHEKNKLIETTWSLDENTLVKEFEADIKIIASDRLGLLFDITKVLSEEKIMVKNINARTGKNDLVIDVSLLLKDTGALNSISKKLNNIKGVYEVQRATV
ncbi:MAG: bifunctional (p)ppGpp synthetase/guanosine-3',5'-bis(diphosphate) 3'-pyrophosphohydrolase [bacterium]